MLSRVLRYLVVLCFYLIRCTVFASAHVPSMIIMELYVLGYTDLQLPTQFTNVDLTKCLVNRLRVGGYGQVSQQLN